MRQGATGRRQGGDRKTTGWRQEDDRKAAGKRQESDRKRQAGDRKATGELRQEGDRRATEERQGGNRETTGKQQETTHSDRGGRRRPETNDELSGLPLPWLATPFCVPGRPQRSPCVSPHTRQHNRKLLFQCVLRARRRHPLKRYPEPTAHGPEACEPSHPLWPMAQRPASRHTLAEAVDTGYPCSLPREIWNPISNQKIDVELP